MVRALHEAVTGHYIGTLLVRDDDPSPQITVTPTASAVEGEPLRWTISLDRPSDAQLYFGFKTVAPAAGLTEMSTDDVRPRWLKRCARPQRDPKPLSKVRFFCAMVEFKPGVTERTLVVPTARDDRVEGDEAVAWKLAWGEPELPRPRWLLTGTVSDPA